MLKVVARKLFSKTCRLLVLDQRASYIRGYWPEPITQQTLDEFLKDINYFEEPRKIVDIGLKRPSIKQEERQKVRTNTVDEKIETKPEKVDEILNLLAHDAEPPQLNYDDVILEGDELAKLAINSGIFRDLFGTFTPDRDYIQFTSEQADNLKTFVPYYWITDNPHARVNRHAKVQDSMYCFSPVVRISAKFVNEFSKQQDSDLYAHTSYYGNIIPASEALVKPSITLDGRSLFTAPQAKVIGESEFNNWTPGNVEFVNFENNLSKHYTIALLNLDHLHQDATNLHWMLTTKVKPSASFEEVCEYLPVHGIRGFGYSRYVFLVFQHDFELDLTDFKIDDFSLESRKFDAKSFIEKHRRSNLLPVGLSWFQTSWDESSNTIFHNYLKLKAPVYEHVQEKLLDPIPDVAYPGKVPFNIFLDHKRDKKAINEQVLLERLKSIDFSDYKNQYVPPKVPPTVFVDEGLPSWMRNVMFKKKNKIGYWRGLRPASATLPLDNNADLDHPLRPSDSSRILPPEFPNQYPAKIKKKPHKEMPTSRPVNEHQAVYVQETHQHHLDEVLKMMKDFEAPNRKKGKKTA